MRTLGVQFESSSNRNNTGKVTFTIDQTQMHSDWKEISTSKLGTPFLLVLFDIDESLNERSFRGSSQETEKEIRNRFQKKLYASAKEKADKTGRSFDDIKLQIKSILKAKNLIKESLSELDSKGYASALYVLEKEID